MIYLIDLSVYQGTSVCFGRASLFIDLWMDGLPRPYRRRCRKGLEILRIRDGQPY